MITAKYAIGPYPNPTIPKSEKVTKVTARGYAANVMKTSYLFDRDEQPPNKALQLTHYSALFGCADIFTPPKRAVMGS